MYEDLELKHIDKPTNGEAIKYENGEIKTPNNPVIPYIVGDGIGVDITPVMKDVVDNAVKKAYNGEKQISWYEVFAGERCFKKFKDCNDLSEYDKWLLPDTLKALEYFKVSIKGPLTTPIGEGFRSLNVAIRQKLDLYTCLRPVKSYGNPSPVISPQDVDMVIFRENTEDIYAGIEFKSGSDEVGKLIKFLQDEMGVSSIRFPDSSGIGIKPISKEGTQRIARAALKYAIDHNKDSVTFVHKGNIMKFTEGAFMKWGKELAVDEFGAKYEDDGITLYMTNPNNGNKIEIKDVIADAFLQQILLRPKEYDVVCTMNLNGDYISDALAASVGGIGIAPGANLNDNVGVFEATHGTAPKHAGANKVNPGSIILSAVMMLEHMGWDKAAQKIDNAMRKAIEAKRVTYDFARIIEGSTKISCSEFGEEIIKNMDS